MKSNIRFKFRAELSYNNLPFDGHYITAGELKRLIAEKKGLGIDIVNELQLTDAASKRDYDNDAEQVTKNSLIIVKRVAAAARPKTLIRSVAPAAAAAVNAASVQGQLSIATPAHVEDEFGESPLAQAASSHEEQQMQAFLNQAAKGMGLESQLALQAAAGRGRGRSRGFGFVPGRGGRGGMMNRECLRCGQLGHFMRECPTQGDPTYDRRVKVPSGIPASKIQRNADGSLYLPDGEMGELVANTQAFNKLAMLMGRGKPAAAEAAPQGGQDSASGSGSVTATATAPQSGPPSATAVWQQQVQGDSHDVCRLGSASIQPKEQQDQHHHNLLQQQQLLPQRQQQQQMQQQQKLLQEQQQQESIEAMEQATGLLSMAWPSSFAAPKAKCLKTTSANGAPTPPGSHPADETSPASALAEQEPAQDNVKPLGLQLFDDEFEDRTGSQDAEHQHIKLALGMNKVARRSTSPAPLLMTSSRAMGNGLGLGTEVVKGAAVLSADTLSLSSRGGRAQKRDMYGGSDEALLPPLCGLGCTQQELMQTLPFLRDLLPGNMAMADLLMAFGSGQPLFGREFLELQAAAIQKQAQQVADRRGGAPIFMDGRKHGASDHDENRRHPSDADGHYHTDHLEHDHWEPAVRSYSPSRGRQSKRSRSDSGSREWVSRSRSRTRSRSPTYVKRRRGWDEFNDGECSRGRGQKRESEREWERGRDVSRSEGWHKQPGVEREREVEWDGWREATDKSPSVQERGRKHPQHRGEWEWEAEPRRQRSRSPAAVGECGKAAVSRGSKMEVKRAAPVRQAVFVDSAIGLREAIFRATVSGSVVARESGALTDVAAASSGGASERPLAASSGSDEGVMRGPIIPPLEETGLTAPPPVVSKHARRTGGGVVGNNALKNEAIGDTEEDWRRNAADGSHSASLGRREEHMSQLGVGKTSRPRTGTARVRWGVDEQVQSDSADADGDVSDEARANKAAVTVAGTPSRQQQSLQQSGRGEQHSEDNASLRSNFVGTGIITTMPSTQKQPTEAAAAALATMLSESDDSGDRDRDGDWRMHKEHKKHKKHKKEKSKDRRKDSKHASKKKHKEKEKGKERVKDGESQREGKTRPRDGGCEYDDGNEKHEYDSGDRYDNGYEDFDMETAPSRRAHLASGPAASWAMGASGGGSRSKYGLGDNSLSRGGDGNALRVHSGGGGGDRKQDSDTDTKRSRFDWLLPKDRRGGKAAKAAAATAPTTAGGGLGDASTRAVPSRTSFAARMLDQTLVQALRDQQRRFGAAGASRDKGVAGREALG